ncbi:unnamed protein product [Amaranthus hypochondriacus]
MLIVLMILRWRIQLLVTNRKDDDNAIICAGGLHHVKKSLASRFCYGDMFFGYLYFLYIIGSCVENFIDGSILNFYISF